MAFDSNQPTEERAANDSPPNGLCINCGNDLAFCSCICLCGKSLLEDGHPGDPMCSNCEELLAQEDARDKEWRQGRQEYFENYEDIPPSMDEPGGADWKI